MGSPGPACPLISAYLVYLTWKDLISTLRKAPQPKLQFRYCTQALDLSIKPLGTELITTCFSLTPEPQPAVEVWSHFVPEGAALLSLSSSDWQDCLSFLRVCDHPPTPG